MRQRGWRLGIKRAVDVAVAGSGLLAGLPVLAATALVIRVTDGSPVLFRQPRPGREGEPFVLVKFRTMTNAVGPDGQQKPDGARLTRVGRLLRSLSLDELPQLWNVFRGDMSLVGPRPLLMQYLPRYTARQARRHEVLPGITGWAQVNGRNALRHEERFELDVWYVDNWSLLLDARILWMTVRTVFNRSGIASENHATMPEFFGTDERDYSVAGMAPHARAGGPVC
ncbi:MAG TPA: sugar transferase [Polyangiaceae bacterium]|nr:sugar transferase [Polyangiaceae bacterium]